MNVLKVFQNLNFHQKEFKSLLFSYRIARNTAGQTHYKRFSVMLARRSGAWFKKALFVAAAKRQFNSFYTKKACSALLRGFESRNRDWEPKNRIFVYNAEALAKKNI